MKKLILITMFLFSSLALATEYVVESPKLECSFAKGYYSKDQSVSISCVSKASIKRDELEIEKLELELKGLRKKHGTENKKEEKPITRKLE